MPGRLGTHRRPSSSLPVPNFLSLPKILQVPASPLVLPSCGVTETTADEGQGVTETTANEADEGQGVTETTGKEADEVNSCRKGLDRAQNRGYEVLLVGQD